MQSLTSKLEGPWLSTTHRCLLRPWRWQSGDDTVRKGFILRDDLLHPWASGNKLRKLDAILTRLPGQTQDIVTCGGIQSAHCLAVAALSREHALRPHLLVRGQPQEHPTGNLAMTMLFGHLYPQSYDVYADRAKMFEAFMRTSQLDPETTFIIPEGASCPQGLLGLVRLIGLLRAHLPDRVTLVIDAGTGASAVGLALGIIHFELDWQVEAICLLKGKLEQTRQDAMALCHEATMAFGIPTPSALPITWFDRVYPRRFGKFTREDIEACVALTRESSVVIDPIYTLAAWRHCLHRPSPTPTCLINTGGGLNIMGAIQRQPGWFHEHT